MESKYCEIPRGSLTMIFGPMFSSKTKTLKARLSVYSAVGESCLLISNSIDERQNITQRGVLTTHDEYGAGIHKSVTQLKVNKLSEVPQIEIINNNIIAIDEAQFFSDILLVKDWLLKYHKVLFVAGLLATSEGTMFGEFYKLLPFAEEIEHLKACCKSCKLMIKNPSIFPKAIMTKCIISKDSDILVGSEGYIPTCINHWDSDNK